MKTIREHLRKSPGWNLGQAWTNGPEKNFQPGTVWFGVDDQNLVVFASLVDADIFTAATRCNEGLHLLGDTLEVFIEKEDRSSYLELHVAPNGLRSQMEWPVGGIERVRNGQAPVSDFVIPDPELFRAEAVIQQKSWEVLCHIPLELLTMTMGKKWPALRVSVSRYDYSSQGGDPVLSSTSRHSMLNFHRFDEWRSVDLSNLN